SLGRSPRADRSRGPMPCQGIRKIYNPKLCAILQPAAPAANLQQTFLFRLTNRECGRTLGGLALVRLRSRYIVIVRQFYGCSIRNHGKLPPPLPLARSRAWMAVSGNRRARRLTTGSGDRTGSSPA